MIATITVPTHWARAAIPARVLMTLSGTVSSTLIVAA